MINEKAHHYACYSNVVLFKSKWTSFSLMKW